MTTAAQQSSKMYGVYYDKTHGVWKAQIQVDKKKESLGRFTSQKQAALAYDAFVSAPAAPKSLARPQSHLSLAHSFASTTCTAAQTRARSTSPTPRRARISPSPTHSPRDA